MASTQEERQELLDFIFRRLRSDLKESELPPDTVKAVTDIMRQTLQEIATSPDLTYQCKPKAVRSGGKTSPPPSSPLHQFWEVKPLEAYMKTKDTKSAKDYRPFNYEGANQGLRVEYAISSRVVPEGLGSAVTVAQAQEYRTVYRRYKEFEKLRQELLKSFRYRLVDSRSAETHRVGFLLIPLLPPKASLNLSSKFEPKFIHERCQALRCWLEYLCRHSLLQLSSPLRHFLSENYADREVHFRNELERRASSFLSQLRRNYTSPKAAALTLSSTMTPLRNALEKSSNALRLCLQSTMNLGESKRDLGDQLLHCAKVEDGFVVDAKQARTSGLASIASMLHAILVHATGPAKPSLLESMQNLFVFFGNQVLLSVRKLISDTQGLKRLDSPAVEVDIEAERAAVECLEADKLRRTMTASRLEEFVQGHVDSARNNVIAYNCLAADIRALEFADVDTFLQVEQRYRELQTHLSDRALDSSLSEALQLLSGDRCLESSTPEFERSLDNSILRPTTPTLDASAFVDLGGSGSSSSAQLLSRRLRSSETKRRTHSHKHPKQSGSTSSPLVQEETETSFEQRKSDSDSHAGTNRIVKDLNNCSGKVPERSTSSESFRSQPSSPKSGVSLGSSSFSTTEGDGRGDNDGDDNWRTAEDSDGQVYFYHSKTRAARWDKPSAKVQAKIESRALESAKRQQSRLEEVRLQRLASEELEEVKRKITREVRVEIEQWKRLSRSNSEVLDLAALLVNLHLVLDLQKFRVTDSHGPKGLSARQLRQQKKELRKLYRNVIKKIHPDKVGPDASLTDTIRCREVFQTLGDYASSN